MADLALDMRILRFDTDTGDELDLHPYVTVLGGFDPGVQVRLVEQFTRIARGDVDGLRGLIEAHGMLVEIDPARVAGLKLSPDADVVVRAEQLPGARIVAAATTENEHQRMLAAKRAAVEAELSRVTAQIRETSVRLDESSAQLDDARRSLDEFAVTAHDAALRAVEEAESLARQRLGQTTDVAPSDPAMSPEDQERERLADQLSDLRHRHQHFETLLDEERLGLLQLLEQLEVERAQLDDLRARLAEQNEAAEADKEPEPEPEPEPELPDRVAMAEVERMIREVVKGPPDAPMVPSLPAAALADQVAAHRQRQRDFERDLSDRGLDPAMVRARLTDARAAEAQAAEAAKPRTIPPEDEREIERLHDEVIEHSDKRHSRRHGKESTRVWESANAKLEVMLERYGFPTYTAYVMGRTMPKVDEGARQRLQEAQRLIAQLERELEEVLAAIDSDPHTRMLRAERDQLWAAAEELLGTVPDDIEAALRAMRVPGSVEFDAPDRLRSALRRLGVDVSSASTTGPLIEVADRWLTDAKEAHAQVSSYGGQAGDLSGVRLPGGFTYAEEGVEADPLETAVADQQRLVDDLLARSARLDEELTERETEFERQSAQIADLEAELVVLDDRRAGNRAEVARREESAQSSARVAVETQLDSDPVVRTAREQAALTESRLRRHHAAVERVDHLHEVIGELRRSERTLIAERDVMQAELESLRDHLTRFASAGVALPPVEWQLTQEGIGPIEWYLLGRVASLRSVSPAGSVPLVLDAAFRGLPSDEVAALCEVLARIGETVQVIYLGDEPAVAEWAQRQGLDHAAVVRPGQPAL